MKKRKPAPYAQFYAQLGAAEQLELGKFFSALHSRILLPKKQKNAMRHDFEAAILVLVQSGVPLREALGRLSLCRLGDFYSTAPSQWYPLDDAAKIYPLSMSHREIKMFRLSVYLTEPVVPELLQIALTFTLRRYPFFAATVKKDFSGIILIPSAEDFRFLPKISCRLRQWTFRSAVRRRSASCTL